MSDDDGVLSYAEYLRSKEARREEKQKARRIQRVQGPRPKRPGPPRRSSRVRDRQYVEIVRSLPCVLQASGEGCVYPLEVDHLGQRGLGQKSSDRETGPLCRKHHRERTDRTGYFKGWSNERMREWCDQVIKLTQQAVESLLARGA